jgi:N-acetylglucosamine-6-phosphate deacetylase
MGPFHHRAPGLVGAAFADDRLSVSLIADLVHTHPVFLRMAFAAKGPAGVALVTDAVASAAGADPTGAGPPRLPDGTLAGSALTMERAVSNAVDRGGVSLVDALTAATATPARLLGLDDRGAIAPGRRADLVALEAGEDGGWHVASVWVGGAPAWARS